MKRALILSLTALLGSAAPALAQDVTNCEVVLMEPIKKDGKDTGAEVASFRPADTFIDSVYDNEDGYVTEIDGYPIRGVMCQRADILPTLRDFPILATGLPFSISDDFDSTDSALMTLYYKDGAFQHKYAGTELSPERQAALDDVIEIYNLQPIK